MPSFSSKLQRGVRRLFRLPRSGERALLDIDDEIRNHIEPRITELRESGLSEAEAEREALLTGDDVYVTLEDFHRHADIALTFREDVAEAVAAAE